MADGKRAAGGGPKIAVATPNIGGGSTAGATVSLEAALVGCVGARIRVTTTLSQTLEGTLFTADPLTNLIAINTAPPPPTPATATTPLQPGDYHIIPIAALQSFQLLSLAPDAASASFESAVPALKPIDMKAARARERAAVEKELRKERARGRGVGREAQEIYDALSRTLPVRWHEQSIIVLDVVMIAPPYTVETCQAAAKDAHPLQRVRKVLEMEKKKLADRSRPAGGGGVAGRKGG
ncbi:MAG: hypothetical protein M1832_001480 [Thelocarpon impressellum]|nr:MAG: hypothetical protein M1832_001480 [Thelocarpon impressellum]